MLSALFRSLRHYVLILCVAFIIFFAVSISLLRVLVPRFAHHQYLQHIAATILQRPVSIGHVETGWYGLQPEIYLNNLNILNKETGASELQIQHMALQINLLSSLIHWQLLPSRITIDGAEFGVGRDQEGQFYILGLHSAHANSNITKMKSVVLWLLTQSDITLKNIHIHYLNSLSLNPFSLRIINNLFEHHLFAQISLANAAHTGVTFIADFDDGDDSLKNLDGKAYVSITHFSQDALDVIKKNIPAMSRLRIKGIQGGAKIWFDFNEGRISDADVYYALSDLKTDALTLQNAYGKVSWKAQNGVNMFTLDNRQGNLQLKRVYTHPIAVGHVVAQGDFQQQRRNWDVRVSQLQVTNPLLAMNASLHIQQCQGRPPVVDLLGGFNLLDLRQLMAYVPQPILKPHFYHWLSQAFLAGNADHGVILYRGPLLKLQPSSHQAHFEFQAQLHHLVMSYAPHWPLAQEGEVALAIRNQLLTANSSHVDSLGNVIDGLSLSIPLKKQTALDLVLHSKTEAYRAWEFIENSPMHLANALKHMRFSGPLALHLKLHIPLHKQPHHDVISQGKIEVQGDQMAMPQWNVNIQNIHGILNFHNTVLNGTDAGLTATVLGHPTTIHVKTAPDSQGVQTLYFNNVVTLSIADLQRNFPLPLTQFFSGQAQFAAELAIHHAKDRGNDLHIASNLVGIGSYDLPRPFAQTAAEARDLKLDITMREGKPLYIRTSYAKLASSALIYDKSPTGMTFRSGDIQLGGKRASFLAQPGLVIRGALSELDWSKWQVFLKRLLDSQQTQHAKQHIVAIRSLSLQVGQLKAYHNTLKQIHLTLTPFAQAWKVGLLNSQMDGYVMVPQNQNDLWRLQFKKLHLDPLKGHANKQLCPQDIPPVTIDVADFSYAKHAYGHVMLNAEHIADGLFIKHLQMTLNDNTLRAGGWWKQDGVNQQTYLSGVLSTTDLGKFVAYADKKLILGGAGRIQFSLHAPTSPLKFSWRAIDGKVGFSFKDGSLVAVDSKAEAEIGVGRLLNLLSVDALFQRLRTHFKDLTQKGLWFDTLDGQFSLKGGTATTTKDIHLKGPVVQIQGWGSIDLANKRSNMSLYVVPQLTSSLPAIVGIFGGPLAGVATWVANKIVGPQINRISASTYRVTGPWKHLKIAKIAH